MTVQLEERLNESLLIYSYKKTGSNEGTKSVYHSFVSLLGRNIIDERILVEIRFTAATMTTTAATTGTEFSELIQEFLRETSERSFDSDDEYDHDDDHSNNNDMPAEHASVEELCQALVDSLHHTIRTNQDNNDDCEDEEGITPVSSTNSHIRTILGTASADTTALVETLTHLISQRQDNVDHLMPTLQNTQTHQDVLLGQAPSITLLPQAFGAAELYAQLAALPGVCTTLHHLEKDCSIIQSISICSDNLVFHCIFILFFSRPWGSDGFNCPPFRLWWLCSNDGRPKSRPRIDPALARSGVML